MTSRIHYLLSFSILAVFIGHFLPLSSKAANNIFYLGIAAPALVFVLLQPKEIALRLASQLVVPLSLLACIIFVSADTIGDMKFVLYLFLFATALSICHKGKDMGQRGMWLASLAAMAILTIISIHWLLLSAQAGTSVRYSQLLGLRINPVHIALLMTTCLSYLWVFHLDRWLQTKGPLVFTAGLLIFSAIALLVVLIFQARSALVGLGLFFAAYIYQGRKYTWHTVSLILFAIGATYILGAGDILANRGVSYRPLIWQDAVRRLMEECSTLWGCGKDGYLFAGQFPHPHSGYISVLYQAGVVGFIAFAVFAGIFLFRSLRSGCRWLPIALIGWGAFLTTSNGMFTSPSHPLWIYFWLPTMMCLIGKDPSKETDLPGNKEI